MASAVGNKIARINKVIRLNRHGCTNRPFYHIVLQKNSDTQAGPVLEQLGSFDAMPNSANEKLVALNLDRIRYWLGQGAGLSDPVAELLGLSGFLPVHPRTVMNSWRNRLEPPRERKIEAIKGVAPPPTNPKL